MRDSTHRTRRQTEQNWSQNKSIGHANWASHRDIDAGCSSDAEHTTQGKFELYQGVKFCKVTGRNSNAITDWRSSCCIQGFPVEIWDTGNIAHSKMRNLRPWPASPCPHHVTSHLPCRTPLLSLAGPSLPRWSCYPLIFGRDFLKASWFSTLPRQSSPFLHRRLSSGQRNYHLQMTQGVLCQPLRKDRQLWPPLLWISNAEVEPNLKLMVLKSLDFEILF